MKISKLYSDQPHLFKTVEFHSGLNVVIGEIRLPENLDKDTHNLGKSTLGRMIDFCLLSGRKKDFFLFKHIDKFKEFTFFLELQLFDGTFLTIRRSVKRPSKISFKKHTTPHQNFSHAKDAKWDHLDVTFENAKTILDGLLDLQSLNPWSYRNFLGYLLRTQADYNDIFQLRKFAGKHLEWKPLVAQVLGFDSDTIANHYKKEHELTKEEELKTTLNAEFGTKLKSLNQIEGFLLIKEEELEEKNKFLDEFNFQKQDKKITNLLVKDLDSQIAELNNTRYRLTTNKSKVSSSLQESNILFNPEEAQELFNEVGVLFDGQLKRDFDELIKFNEAITQERRQYLQEELEELTSKIITLDEILEQLNKQRSKSLAVLNNKDSVKKYKEISKSLVGLQADIEVLKRQKESAKRLEEIEDNIRTLQTQANKLALQVKENVKVESANKDGLFATIRLHFNSIIKNVISQRALLSVLVNGKNHLEFNVELLDAKGRETSAGDGNTYKKLLCIAYDMAMIRAHSADKFPKFMFHDGVFESLDDRKKINLMKEIREGTNAGTQHIITLIDSELPPPTEDMPTIFNESEIVLRLHDEDKSGRLFMMESW